MKGKHRGGFPESPVTGVVEEPSERSVTLAADSSRKLVAAGALQVVDSLACPAKQRGMVNLGRGGLRRRTRPRTHQAMERVSWILLLRE